MREQVFRQTVNLPEVEDFKKAYPRFNSLINGAGRELYEAIVQPSVLIRAEAAVEFRYPAVLAAAEITQQFLEKYNVAPGDLFTRHLVGSAICMLMEANGYKKTGTKRRVPHRAFTTGEVYQSA